MMASFIEERIHEAFSRSERLYFVWLCSVIGITSENRRRLCLSKKPL
jgi:hypothetical protein